MEDIPPSLMARTTLMGLCGRVVEMLWMRKAVSEQYISLKSYCDVDEGAIVETQLQEVLLSSVRFALPKVLKAMGNYLIQAAVAGSRRLDGSCQNAE
jgi:hypothetical protein